MCVGHYFVAYFFVTQVKCFDKWTKTITINFVFFEFSCCPIPLCCVVLNSLAFINVRFHYLNLHIVLSTIDTVNDL